jgi:hypothetical protein
VSLCGLGLLVVGVQGAKAPSSPRGTTSSQAASASVRVENNTLIVEPQAGRYLLVVGKLHPGDPANYYRDGRIAIPTASVDTLRVYEARPVFYCKDNNCMPCRPDSVAACLGPLPAPPPPPPGLVPHDELIVSLPPLPLQHR